MSYEWKPGQQVALFGGYGRSLPRPQKIDRVTPSGRAVIGGAQFRPDGWEIGAEGWRSRSRIKPWTDEHAQNIRAAQLVDVKQALCHLRGTPADIMREGLEATLSEWARNGDGGGDA